jgi:hypothetical protein
VELVGWWLMGPVVKIMVCTLVGFTLAYVDRPDAGGGDREMGLLES